MFQAILWHKGVRVQDELVEDYQTGKEMLDDKQEALMKHHSSRVHDFDRMIERVKGS